MKYILVDEAVTITPPSGLYLVVADIEGTGTMTIEDSSANILANSPLPQVFAFPITITASGSLHVIVKQAGGQSAGDVFDSNGSNGHYPGRWGSGVGSR